MNKSEKHQFMLKYFDTLSIRNQNNIFQSLEHHYNIVYI